MPFKSQAQRRFMYANHPKMAKEWAKHTSDMTSLPQKKHDPLKTLKMIHKKHAKKGN